MQSDRTKKVMADIKEKNSHNRQCPVVTIDRGLQCLDFARVAARHGRKVRDLSSYNAVPMILPG